jgi:hypothetical protein
MARACRPSHHLGGRVRLVLGDVCIVGKGRWPAAAVRWGSNPLSGRSTSRGPRREGPVTWNCRIPVVTACARRGPAASDAVRTQRGPARPHPYQRSAPGPVSQDRICDLHKIDRWRPLRTAWFRWRVDKRGPGRAAQRSGRFGSVSIRASQVSHKGFEAYCEALAHSPLDGGLLPICSTSASEPWRSSRPASAFGARGPVRVMPTHAAPDSRRRSAAWPGGKRGGAPPWPAVPAGSIS